MAGGRPGAARGPPVAGSRTQPCLGICVRGRCAGDSPQLEALKLTIAPIQHVLVCGAMWPNVGVGGIVNCQPTARQRREHDAGATFGVPVCLAAGSAVAHRGPSAPATAQAVLASTICAFQLAPSALPSGPLQQLLRLWDGVYSGERRGLYMSIRNWVSCLVTLVSFKLADAAVPP